MGTERARDDMAGSSSSKWCRTPVQSLPIHPRILSALRKGGILHVSSVLEESYSGLGRRTGLSGAEVKGVVNEVAGAVLAGSPSPSTALSLYLTGQTQHCWGRLSVGCGLLDSSLRGGLLVSGLTEIAGTSAAGKTQLCLQLCLTAQLPRTRGGLSSGAVYICTEDVFPTKRLQQLTEYFSQRHTHSHPSLTAQHLSDNIFVEHVATISSLAAQLEYKLPALLSTGRVGVVIIDSIAALFRAEYGAGQAAQRAAVLQTCGARLHHLSASYRVAVVCVNQVTAVMEERGGGVAPALGLAWASLVTSRITLSRDETVHSNLDCCKVPTAVKRQLEVVFSPHLPPVSVDYYVTSAGVHGNQNMANCCPAT